MNEELYLLLGVEKTASAAEIKAAYRKIVKIHHPDAGGDPEMFHRLTMAYNVLSDPEMREKYDLSGDFSQENPMKLQMEMIAALGNLFSNVVLRIDRPIEEVDVIALMQADLYDVTMQNEHVADVSGRVLKSFHKARDRIKPKNDAEENDFVKVVDMKIAEASKRFNEAKYVLKILNRAREELDRYKSIIDVVRTVHWGSSSTAFGGGMGNYSIFWPTPT